MEIEKEIILIKERNLKVEADKAWETSFFRIVLISIVTYVIASFVMYFIGVKNFLLNALIPTIGYLLSAQSLPLIKHWWIKEYLNKKNC